MYDHLSRLRRLSAAQHRTSQLLARFQHLQSLLRLALRGLWIPTCCRICLHNCRRPSNKLRYACSSSAGSLLSCCYIVQLHAGAVLLTLADIVHVLQAQPWQGVPGLLQTLQLTQLLNQPHNPQAPNLAMLLGSQLANAGGAAAPQGHQAALQQVCCSPGVPQYIPSAD